MISVGPPLGVDPVGKMRLRIPNKQTKKYHRGEDALCLYDDTTMIELGGGVGDSLTLSPTPYFCHVSCIRSVPSRVPVLYISPTKYLFHTFRYAH